jgi:hypothetical protein
MRIAALALSRIFSALVESGDRAYFPQKTTVNLSPDVGNPTRVNMMHSALGMLLHHPVLANLVSNPGLPRAFSLPYHMSL